MKGAKEQTGKIRQKIRMLKETMNINNSLSSLAATTLVLLCEDKHNRDKRGLEEQGEYKKLSVYRILLHKSYLMCCVRPSNIRFYFYFLINVSVKIMYGFVFVNHLLRTNLSNFGLFCLLII